MMLPVRLLPLSAKGCRHQKLAINCKPSIDESHLANDRFRNRLKSIELDKKIKVFTPKEFFEYLQNAV